ncbi:Endonuclease YncB, thermonuclease family [Methylomagnum ishizawai]|uniref:Endonuclease YncB, thermonuclease family n=1 Tax=Methylomagnum ishizawai TaxID=1760988 RepID=A0A1Y6D4E3_9GAMM|nr:thermonuclease family protein [Methylomagnum ishizawai]SMF95254.1 Endonuclease YncB, thermonuclease family [Methylomagnum ishizawai]
MRRTKPGAALRGLCLRLAAAGAALLAWGAAEAGDWSGRVLRVHDGDTLTLLRAGREVTVRLNEIDAPELDQPHGEAARRALVGLCLNRDASIHDQGVDKYDRTLGRVSCGGTDANAEQVKAGHAWFYAQYSQDAALRGYEAEARRRRIGLWSARNPQPPWEFRHMDGGTHREAQRGGLCGAKRTCGEMVDCGEALFYLQRCGVKRLDSDKDGVPCESLCQGASPSWP